MISPSLKLITGENLVNNMGVVGTAVAVTKRT
jgi:hypothetical protein